MFLTAKKKIINNNNTNLSNKIIYVGFNDTINTRNMNDINNLVLCLQQRSDIDIQLYTDKEIKEMKDNKQNIMYYNLVKFAIKILECFDSENNKDAEKLKKTIIDLLLIIITRICLDNNNNKRIDVINIDYIKRNDKNTNLFCKYYKKYKKYYTDIVEYLKKLLKYSPVNKKKNPEFEEFKGFINGLCTN